MKIGVCRGLDDFDGMKAAAGYVDYWEIGFGALADYDDEKFELCKKTLSENGIGCIAANCFIPGKFKLTGENVDYGDVCEYLDKGFDRAGKLGIKKVVFGSGGARSFPEAFSKEKAEEQLAYFLKELVAPRAEKAGCIVVTEPLRFCESNIIHTVFDAVKLARKVDESNIASLADLYHVYGNNDDLDGIENFKNEVCHAHIAEPVNRRYPSENDSEEVKNMYKRFFSTLEKAGCDTCSIEGRTDDFENDIKAATAFLREILR